MLAGIFVRVSSEQQARTESPQNHLLRGQAYCETRGWTVAAVYMLEGVSGVLVENHPEYIRMKADVAAGRVQVLVFSNLSRVARSFLALVSLSFYFRDYNAHFASLTEQLDTTTSMGRAFFWLLAIVAEIEREKIAERVAEVVPLRASMGKKMGGSSPYGYHWVDGVLQLNPKEEAVRREIYDLFIQHGQLHIVAKILNGRSIPSPRNSKWNGSMIKRVIRDTTAKGVRITNYSTKVPGKKGKGFRVMLKPESEWFTVPAPQLISVEKWDLANKLLDELDEKTKDRKPQQFKYMFVGHLFCGCGARMNRDHERKKRIKNLRYRCRRPGCGICIRADELERLFLDEFETFYCQPEAGTATLKEAIANQERLIDGQSSALSQVKNQLAKIEADYFSGHLTAPFFTRKSEELEAQKEKIQADLARLQGELDYRRELLRNAEQTLAEARDILLTWEELSLEARRQLADQIVDRIVVTATDVEIDLLYLPEVFIVRR